MSLSGKKCIAAICTLSTAMLVLSGAISCSPFYAGVNAGSTPEQEESFELLINAFLIAASTRFRRSVFLTNNFYDGQFDGSFGPFDGDGIDEADRFCTNEAAQHVSNTPFAALLSDGTNRVATLSPDCRQGCTGQVDWPLRAYTDYFLPDGRFLFGTGAAPIFVFGALSDQITVLTGTQHWSGLKSDWTPSAVTCLEWVTGSGGDTGRTGESSSMSQSFLQGSERTCDLFARLICVEL